MKGAWYGPTALPLNNGKEYSRMMNRYIMCAFMVGALSLPISSQCQSRSIPVDIVDRFYLESVAHDIGVPVQVMLAVAWQESRTGDKGNAYRGPGREQCDSTGCKRVCREIGRGQINPCIKWGFPGCSSLHTYRYNVRCMGWILRAQHARHGTWALAIKHYNGSGPSADRYLQQALAFIGRLTLEEGTK